MRIISSSSIAVISDAVNTTIILPKVELYYIIGVNVLIMEEYRVTIKEIYTFNVM